MNFNQLGNIRFYVLSFSILLSVSFYLWVRLSNPDLTSQIISLTKIYALTATFFLYITLLTTPLGRTFTSLPFRGQYIKARRALGVSAFYFGLLHVSLAFFGQLGGFGGLGFLEARFLLAIILGFTALVILGLMSSTAFDFMITKLSFPKWKFLHRFVYLAAFLICIHALMLGTHFQDLSSPTARIYGLALAVLLILEAKRFDEFLQSKFLSLPKFGFSVLMVAALIVVYFFLFFN